MWIYYTVHILIFLACLYEGKSDNTKKRVLWALMLMVTLFGGLRWQIGGDWDQYYEHFRYASFDNIFNYYRGDKTMEPLFVFFNALVKQIFGTFWAYNLLVVGFIQWTYYKMSWYFSPKYPILFYSFMMIMVSNYFPVRAGFAIGICFHAYMAAKEEKLIRYCVVLLLGYLVHIQSIVLLPLYFFKHLNKYVKPLYFTLIFAVFATAGVVLQDYFQILISSMSGDAAELAAHYTEVANEGISQKTNSYIGWALNFFFMLMYFYVRKQKNLQEDSWYNSLLVCILVYNGLYMVFKEGMGELCRLAYLFFPAQSILYISTITYFMDNSKYRKLAMFFFVAYYLYKLRSVGSGFYFAETCLPYKTIFDYPSLY